MSVDGIQGGMMSMFQNRSVREKSNQTLGINEFLQLIAAQMQNQDMFNPMSDTDMIAQLAQFSSLQAMQNLMNLTSSSYSASLLGKEVTVARLLRTGELQTRTGIVTGVGLYQDNPIIHINNSQEAFELGEIMIIGKSPGTEIPVQTPPEQPGETPPPAEEPEE